MLYVTFNTGVKKELKTDMFEFNWLGQKLILSMIRTVYKHSAILPSPFVFAFICREVVEIQIFFIDI